MTRVPRGSEQCLAQDRTESAGYSGSGSGSGSSEAEVYAALDLGTNNCRLLVARPQGEGFRVIDAFSRIVRLGEGLNATGRLCEPAMLRTLQALRICAGKIRRRGARRVRAVATQACRSAVNCDVFLERVYRDTGIELEVIGQEEEARLALLGCAPLLAPAIPNALIFDIGGGSTEVNWLAGKKAGAAAPATPSAWVESAELAAWHSMPIGVVSLAEKHGCNSVSPALFEAMVEETADALAPFTERHDVARVLADGQVQMLGTSGTVTTLAGVYQNLARYDRSRVDGCYLGFDTVRDVSRRIAAMSYRERVQHPCIGDQRADLVVAGCAILEAICRSWPVGKLRVADRGLREGILFELMRGPSNGPSGAKVSVL